MKGIICINNIINSIRHTDYKSDYIKLYNDIYLYG